MAETEGYTYRVLVVLEDPLLDVDDDAAQVKRHLADLGEWDGRTAREAIETAVEDGGLPQEDGGRCIAVPVSKWHERDVVIEQRPHVSVQEVEDELPDEDDKPPPEPPDAD